MNDEGTFEITDDMYREMLKDANEHYGGVPVYAIVYPLSFKLFLDLTWDYEFMFSATAAEKAAADLGPDALVVQL